MVQLDIKIVTKHWCVDDDVQLRDFAAPEVEFDRSATECALLCNKEVYLATIIDKKCVKISKNVDLGKQVEDLVCQFTRSNTLFLKDGSTLKYYPALDQLSKAYIPRDIARVILEQARIAIQFINAFLQICSLAGDVGRVNSQLERFDPSTSVCSLVRLNKPSYAQIMSLKLPVPLQYASLQPFNAMILNDNRFSKNEILATQLGVRLTIAFDWVMSQKDEEYLQLQQSFSQHLKSSNVTFSDAEFDLYLEQKGFWDDIDSRGQAIVSDTEWYDHLQIEEENGETQIEDDVQEIINDFSETVKAQNATGQLEEVLTRMHAKIDKMQAGELSDDDSILGSDKVWDSEANDDDDFSAQWQTTSNRDVNDREQQNSDKEHDEEEDEEAEFEKFVQSAGDDVLDNIGFKVHQILSQMTL
ncbi:hypothetical protein MP228_003466 [Amoeboaphelidium protococcarum]|nr:hypothetical protein MP228_003466 [Amoeboaphelidium protococcarum]